MEKRAKNIIEQLTSIKKPETGSEAQSNNQASMGKERLTFYSLDAQWTPWTFV